jgi:hypothetical protein
MIELADLADPDDRDERSETDRRGVLRAGGLLVVGGAAGLLGRPAAEAAAEAAKPDDPIRGVSLDDGSLRVDLADGADLLMLRIIRNGVDLVEEDPYLDDPTAYRVVPETGDTYRVTAYRGEYLDPDEVQSVEVTKS